MQKRIKKLALNRETLKQLSQPSMSAVAGGASVGPGVWMCRSDTYLQVSGNVDCNIQTTFC